MWLDPQFRKQLPFTAGWLLSSQEERVSHHRGPMGETLGSVQRWREVRGEVGRTFIVASRGRGGVGRVGRSRIV